MPHFLAQWPEREGDAGIPAITLGERSQMQHVLAGLVSSRTAAGHPLAHDGLTRCFDIAAADGQPFGSGVGVAHSMALFVDVRDGFVDDLDAGVRPPDSTPS